MDAHYRQSAIEHLSALGLAFIDAPTGIEGKYASYMYLRACFRAGKMRIPNNARLLTQLRAVTMVPMPGGKVKIVSPRRAGQGHGDTFPVSCSRCGKRAARSGQRAGRPS
jgi:hypothetical protein